LTTTYNLSILKQAFETLTSSQKEYRMKYTLALIKTILAVILSTIGTVALCFFIYTAFLVLVQKTPPPINSPAIAEYQETRYVRNLLSPSVFTVEARLFVSEKNAEKPFFCSKGYGSAFMVNEKGYFVTNNHVIDPASKQTACLEGMAKTKDIPVSSLFGVRFEIKYFLTDFEGTTFPVTIAKAFPERDLAVLKVDGATISQKWKPVEFRTGTPVIIDGKVTSEKGPMILPDEPIITMGTPLELTFTIARGMLGNGVFQTPDGETFIHFIAPNNSGNSGGPLFSLLDFRVIGMSTVSKADNQSMSEQAGAIPFWVIQKALQEVEMK